MALNPVAFTEKVVSSFLRYQLTAYPFADPDLYKQMRRLLSLEATRDTPLLKGPYISLSRRFREGARVADLTKDGLLHPFLDNLVEHPRLYGHQEKAIPAPSSGAAPRSSRPSPENDWCLAARARNTRRDSNEPRGNAAKDRG